MLTKKMHPVFTLCSLNNSCSWLAVLLVGCNCGYDILFLSPPPPPSTSFSVYVCMCVISRFLSITKLSSSNSKHHKFFIYPFYLLFSSLFYCLFRFISFYFILSLSPFLFFKRFRYMHPSSHVREF